MKKVEKCNYEMEKVVNSDGSTEWKTFLDVRKSVFSWCFRRLPRIHAENVKKSIEKIFKVNVVKINTIKLKGKIKMVKNKKASKPGFKKAIITLKKGQSIDLTTGI